MLVAGLFAAGTDGEPMVSLEATVGAAAVVPADDSPTGRVDVEPEPTTTSPSEVEPTTTPALDATVPDGPTPAPGGPTPSTTPPLDYPDAPPAAEPGEPEEPGWTGVVGVARYRDGSTKPICVLLSDRNGSHTSFRVTPGVAFAVAFPPRPMVATWIGACDEGPPFGGIHTELTPTIAVRADGPTPVDWTVTRNVITVDLLVRTAAGHPVGGICVQLANATHRTDDDGRLVVPDVPLALAAVQVGYGCPDGNWLSGLEGLAFLTGDPESVVQHRITLDRDPSDDFGAATAPRADGVIEFVRATLQPGEPTPSCAPGPPTGSTWHGPLDGWMAAFLRPSSGDGGSVIAVWEGTGLGDLREIACVRSPAGIPFNTIWPNPSGLDRYVQFVDTGAPDVAGFTVDVS